MSGQETMKIVYTVVERSPGKAFWTRVGVGFVNRDGSLNLRLDAMPVNGTLQVRDWEERDGIGKPPAANAPPASMPRGRPRAETGQGAARDSNRETRAPDTAGGLA